MPPKRNKKIEQPKQSSQGSASQEQIREQKYVLYKLLDVERNATQAQIKSSYKKLALKVHPDKNKQDPQAADKFNKLTQAYKILTNPQKRKEYDETGTISEDFNQETFQTAYEYYRKIYKKIEKQDIDAFEKRYRHGQMQQEDLLNYYAEHNGDMVKLLQSIPLSVNEDVPRFIKFFQDKIAQNVIEQTNKFLKTKNKVRKIKLQEQQAKFQQQKKKKQNNTKNSMNALVQAIQGKKTGFIQMLEQKYGQGKKEKSELPKKKRNK